MEALKPVKVATMFLQQKDITLGDFYGCWWKCMNGLERNGTILALQIKKNMEARQKILFDNEMFVAGNHTYVFNIYYSKCTINYNIKYKYI